MSEKSDQSIKRSGFAYCVSALEMGDFWDYKEQKHVIYFPPHTLIYFWMDHQNIHSWGDSQTKRKSAT